MQRCGAGRLDALTSRYTRLSCLALVLMMCQAGLASLPVAAQAKIVRAPDGQIFGIVPTPSPASTSSAIGSRSGTSSSSSRAIRSFRSAAQAPLAYGGGPLMLTSSVYLIFWGPAGSFDPAYESAVRRYVADLAADSGKLTDAFSVVTRYTDANHRAISDTVSLAGTLDDTTPYPAGGCASTASANPCLTDGQLQSELRSDIAAQGWPADPASAPQHHYVLLTPLGVDSCDGTSAGSCTNGSNAFCGYHSQFGLPGGSVVTYTDQPDLPKCASGQAPAGAGDANSDGTLDTLIHELAEAATDPDGSGYTDSSGNEIGDKCTNPVVTSQLDVYGTPLGGSLEASTAYNQVINGDTFYTQQMWSNAPTLTPATPGAAGCSSRLGPSPQITLPPTLVAGQAALLDGAQSSDIANPISSYTWDYGDGSAPDATSGPRTLHTYSAPGTYNVKLTVSDASGNPSTEILPVIVSLTGAAGAPTAAFTSPGSAQASHPVAFDGSGSSDPAGAIAAYVWNYGDGSALDASSGAQPTHSYAAGGAYTVTLTVIDTSGQASSVSHPVTVTAGIPSAVFTVPVGVQAGKTAAFDGSASGDQGANLVAYAWNYGDGTPLDGSSGAHASHAYAAPGTYTVTLTVLDSTGQTSSISHPVTVISPPPPGSGVAAAVATIQVDSKGVATILIGCRGPGSCAGRLSVASSAGSVIGTTAYSLAAGNVAVLRAHVASAALKSLRARHKLGGTLTLAPASGKAVRETVTLKPS